MARLPYYEPTMLQDYQHCPEKFRLRYIEGHPPVGTPPMFRGLVGHHVLANPDESLDELLIAAVTNYKTGVLKPWFDLPMEDEMKLHHDLATMIHNWYRFSAMRSIEILEREKPVNFTIGTKKISGTIDIVYRLPSTPEGKVCIGDFKFGRKQSDRQMNRNIQHGLYWYGLTLAGYDVDHNAWISMNDLVPYKEDGKKGKRGDYKGQVIYPVKIDVADKPYIETITLSIIRAIENDVWWPSSYIVDGPCATCEYANKECARFSVGRDVNFVEDLLAMRQAVREAALQKEQE